MALRIGNQVIDSPAEEILVLRGHPNELVITARAVLSMEDFDRYCPVPVAHMAFVAGKGNIRMTEDPRFKADMETYGEKRFAFMAIKSLEPSDIEWARVKLDEPNTWVEWTEELKDAGLSETEIQRIIVCVMQANSLDENKLKEAKAAFLQAREQELEKLSTPSTEPSNTASGLAANDGE